MKRVMTSGLIAAALLGSAIQPALARDHHHDTGRIIAGGVAAGLVGGLVGGALANNNAGPRYIDPPPPPPPQCWYEERSFQNTYDDDYHTENVRICR